MGKDHFVVEDSEEISLADDNGWCWWCWWRIYFNRCCSIENQQWPYLNQCLSMVCLSSNGYHHWLNTIKSHIDLFCWWCLCWCRCFNVVFHIYNKQILDMVLWGGAGHCQIPVRKSNGETRSMRATIGLCVIVLQISLGNPVVEHDRILQAIIFYYINSSQP